MPSKASAANNNKRYRLIHIAIFLNIITAINTIIFWIGFFTEFLFPVKTLKPLIKYQ